MEKEISTILSHFGFTEQEIEIYLAVIKLGSCGVSDIAQKTEKGRTAIYFHIKNLIEKGLLKETRYGKKQSYVALAPAELSSQIDKWADDFKKRVPELESLKKVEKETPTIELTESKLGYWKIYDELSSMPNGSIFRVIQGRDSFQQELDILSEEQLTLFFDRIIKNDIGTKAIFTKEAFQVPQKKMKKNNRERMQSRRWDLKTLPKIIFDMQQLMFLYNNKVAFLFPEVEMVMTISHKGIYDVLTTQFDALHTLADKGDPKKF